MTLYAIFKVLPHNTNDMKYEMQDYDGTMMFQPKNLLTKEDEHDLLWKTVIIMAVLTAVAIFNLEHWGVVDQAILYLVK